MNVGFLGDAVIRDLPRAEIIKRKLPMIWHGEVTKDLTVVTATLHPGGDAIVIPAGMLTDGASIPHFLWNMLSDTDPDILYPSYIHDYIYLLSGKLPSGLTFTRQQADMVIREQMQTIGAPTWKCTSVYETLRAYGGNAWDKQRTPLLVETARRLAEHHHTASSS